MKEPQREAVPAIGAGTLVATTARLGDQIAGSDWLESLPLDQDEDDPLSRAQVLASIRAAKRLHLPTGEVLRAVRRQIDQD